MARMSRMMSGKAKAKTKKSMYASGGDVLPKTTPGDRPVSTAPAAPVVPIRKADTLPIPTGSATPIASTPTVPIRKVDSTPIPTGPATPADRPPAVPLRKPDVVPPKAAATPADRPPAVPLRKSGVPIAKGNYAKGGTVKINGCAIRGKTKGKVF